MHLKRIRSEPIQGLIVVFDMVLKIKAMKLIVFFFSVFFFSALLKSCTYLSHFFFPPKILHKSPLTFFLYSLSSVAFLRPSIDDIVDIVGCSLPCNQRSTF